jgi:hypothetical protein
MNVVRRPLSTGPSRDVRGTERSPHTLEIVENVVMPPERDDVLPEAGGRRPDRRLLGRGPGADTAEPQGPAS